MYSPYTLQPRENDLYKINVRNENNSYYHRQDDFEENDPFAGNKDTYSELSDGEKYSVFDMSRSYYSDQGFNDSKIGISSQKTVGKNKAAFFKKSGVLIREDEFEVAYKRSDPKSSDNYTKVRIILYFNNKTGNNKKVDVDYDYEKKYYSLEVK